MNLTSTQAKLIRHATEACHDPDCEVHNPDVAIKEEVANYSAIAWFLAGATTAVAYYDGEDTLVDHPFLDDLVTRLGVS